MGPCRHGRRTQAARLRPARRDEAAALSALVLRSKAFWGSDEAFLDACVEDLRLGADEVIERRTVVAERDGSVVGVATLEGVAPDGVLGLLFVEPGAVLTGVGRRLYRHVLEEAGRLGFDWVTIVSDPHAEGFYRAMGAPRQAAEHSLPVLVGWPIRPEPSWSVAWAPGPSIHIGNVAEFNGQFGPPMGGPPTTPAWPRSAVGIPRSSSFRNAAPSPQSPRTPAGTPSTSPTAMRPESCGTSSTSTSAPRFAGQLAVIHLGWSD